MEAWKRGSTSTALRKKGKYGLDRIEQERMRAEIKVKDRTRKDRIRSDKRGNDRVKEDKI